MHHTEVVASSERIVEHFLRGALLPLSESEAQYGRGGVRAKINGGSCGVRNI